MSYAVSATTSNGAINVHSGSAAEIRSAIAEARKAGATSVSLSEDGKSIDESQIGQLTSSLVSATSTMTKYA
ncbi:hypothetical protein [Sphingomonas oryzagri]|jgi:hypothetical protein|uniref:Uncharacterized protein n=1 Tax=Sphingomonas oryzagri TaxID=3042314 RepID=A0ABT6N349_9SPHN|nr:hypothetical protein [Sphingomonas oryzagri]MDH7639715.1 hypothetical protein [Sphingomonas oryzagri]